MVRLRGTCLEDGGEVAVVGGLYGLGWIYQTADPREMSRGGGGVLEFGDGGEGNGEGVSSRITEIPAPTEGGQEDVAKENAYLELADPDEGTVHGGGAGRGGGMLSFDPSDEAWVMFPSCTTTNMLGQEEKELGDPQVSEVSAAVEDGYKPPLKVTITQKDNDISLLDSRATHLASSLDDAKVACAEAEATITSLASERDSLASEVSSLCAGFQDFKEKMEVQQEEQAQELYNRVAELEAHVMDVFGRLEGEFYPTYLTLLAGRRWLLTHGIQLALLKCLKSSEYQGILVDAYNPKVASAYYVNAVKALEDAHFPLVDLLKSKKDAGMDDVLDFFLLDGPLAELLEAASLQPCIEQLSILIHHAGDKMAVRETSLSFALMNVHARAEGAKKHVAALRQLLMEIVSAPLSS
ncbi:hypothetical protein Tco_0205499 [Tanacetum coccineum]